MEVYESSEGYSTGQWKENRADVVGHHTSQLSPTRSGWRGESPALASIGRVGTQHLHAVAQALMEGGCNDEGLHTAFDYAQNSAGGFASDLDTLRHVT